MSIGYDKLADGLGKAIETVPELYDDALKTTAQETGKTIALIPQTINAALLPLRKWIAFREYNMEETKKLIAKKLAHISDEKIVTPEPYVAVPALQAISYSMDSHELRELYANLLAKSMNSDTKDSVHPSFVDIIKTLSPLDCRVLKNIVTNHTPPAFGFYEIQALNTNSGSYKIMLPYATSISFSTIEEVACSIDNLIRNSLVSISDNEYTNNEIYNEIDNNPEYIKYKNIYEKRISKLGDYKFHTEKKAIKCTYLGLRFYNICVEE